MEKKKQSGGLLRRLFGVDGEIEDNGMQESKQTKVDSRVPKEDQSDKVGGADTAEANGILDDALELPPQENQAVKRNEVNDLSKVGQAVNPAPTWEELLERIAPLKATVDRPKSNTEIPRVHTPTTTSDYNKMIDPLQSIDTHAENLPWEVKSEVLSEEDLDNQPEIDHETDVQPTLNQTEVSEEHLARPLSEPITRTGALSSDNLQLSVQPLRVKGPILNEHVTWLMELAEECSALGEFVKAEKFLEIALALEVHPDVLLALGRFELSIANTNKASDYCLRSLELYPDELNAYELLAQISEIQWNKERVALLKPHTPAANAKLAELCLQYGSLEQALNLFTQAQSLGMDMDELQLDLGILHAQMGNFQQAYRHYQNSLAKTGDINTAFRLFDLYLEQESYQAATEIGQEYFASSSEPDAQTRWAQLQLLQAKNLYEAGRNEEAIEGFFEAFKAGNTEAKTWLIKSLRLATEELWQSDPVRAIDYGEKLLELDPSDMAIATSLGEAYLSSGNFAKALKFYELISSEKPGNPDTEAAVAECYLGLGQFDRAAALWERLINNGHGDRNTRERLFNYYRSQGNFTAAKEHLNLLYDSQSDAYRAGVQSLAWEHIRFLMEQGQTDQAWEICIAEIRSNPSSDMLGMATKLLFERLDKLVIENRVNEALQELVRAQNLGLNGLDLSLREASLYELSGKDQEALEIYKDVATKAPEVWSKIKELYLKAATREYLAANMLEARRLLEEAHTNLPDNEEIRRALGVLYQETGQFALAVALAQNSMEETDIQISTDHLNVLRPHSYRRIRLG